MRLSTKVLLGIVATGTVVAVAMTQTVHASRSIKPVEGAAVTAQTPALASRIETSPITAAEVVPVTIGSEVGYFIGTADGNGYWSSNK